MSLAYLPSLEDFLKFCSPALLTTLKKNQKKKILMGPNFTKKFVFFEVCNKVLRKKYCSTIPQRYSQTI